MTASSRQRSARPHQPLIAGLTPGKRAALATDLLAANLLETIEAAVTQARPERIEVSAAPSAASQGEYPSVMGPDQAAACCAIGVNRRNRENAP